MMAAAAAVVAYSCGESGGWSQSKFNADWLCARRLYLHVDTDALVAYIFIFYTTFICGINYYTEAR